MVVVVDSFMLGKGGAVPLAASAIANGLFFLIFVIGLGITFAISPLVAISSGAKRQNDFNNILQQSLFSNIIIGILLTVVIFLIADFINYLNQPKEVAAQAIIFLKIIGLSMVPLMIFQTFKQFIEGMSIMIPAMVISILANIVNYFGNWIFVFGNLGFPRLGLTGSGYSTLITRIFMAAVLLFYVMNAGHFKEYNLSLLVKRIDFNLIRKILRLGFPSGVQYFFEIGAFSFSAIMIGWLGTKALAAHQIAINLASITYMSATGISSAAAIRVGNAVGSENIIETVSMMSFFALMFIIFNNFFPSLYIEDGSVVSIASSLLIIAAFFQIFDGSQAVGLGMLRGLMDVRIPTIITFIAYWILMIPAGFILGFEMKLGIQGIWIGYILGLAFSAILLNFRFHLISKQKIHL